MGAWGARAFDNDAANDWAYDLEHVTDLSLVEAALAQVEAVGADYLDSDDACDALAACEVLARLAGNPGYQNSYTKKIDRWVAANPRPPSPALLGRARAVIDRILGDASELRSLWEGQAEWDDAMADLRRRLG